MTRKNFLQQSISAAVYFGVGSTLISCLDDQSDFIEDDGIKINFNTKTYFKPIYLISENSNVNTKRPECISLLDKWTIIKEIVTYGYITSTQLLPAKSLQTKIKVVKLNNELSCVLFKEPIKTYIPETFTKLEFQYTIYEELEAEFAKKTIKF